MPKLIIHCVNSFSSLSGGVGFSLKSIINNNSDYKHVILTLKDSEPLLEIDKSVKIFVFKRNGPYLFSYSYSLEKYLFKLLKKEKEVVLHVHGLWSGLSLTALKIKNKLKHVNLILSTHGMLSKEALKRRKIFKFLYGYFIEKKLLKFATNIHLLNKQELNNLNYFHPSNGYAIIPHPQEFKYSTRDIEQFWNKKRNKSKKLVYIGRLHETKGIIEMLNCLDKIVKSGVNLNYRIDIYGFGSSKYVSKVKTLIKLNKLNAKFHGPIFSVEKTKMFKESHGVILPSQTEGLPMSLIEASSFGLPLFITKECNIEWVENNINGYSVAYSEKNLIELLIKFNTSTINDLIRMGKSNFTEAKKICDKNIVKRQWSQLYSAK